MNDLPSLIRSRLATIPEPCSLAFGVPTNLVAMGLIDDVFISPEGVVTITMCLTDAGCVHFTSMKMYIGDEVGALEGVREVRVIQALDKLWTPDRVQG
jgi:metal-sulfur cluster biosynthetic enzyme